jgi:hypothetical protein
VRTTATVDALLELERLRAEHADLKREFERLQAERPRSIPDHHRLLACLAAHRQALRRWQEDFQRP